MTSPMIITLIGYRGSGKSSLARPLADRLGWRAVDADDEIERRAGKSIADIFADEGEPRFRELERQVMGELLAENRLVIAAGGGAVMDDDTRRAMQAAGPVVWLKADVGALAARIGGDDTTAARRPALTETGTREEIARVLARREPVYRGCATAIIDSSRRTVDELVEEVLAALGPLAGKDG